VHLLVGCQDRKIHHGLPQVNHCKAVPVQKEAQLRSMIVKCSVVNQLVGKVFNYPVKDDTECLLK
jgi:hypothetical protein